MSSDNIVFYDGKCGFCSKTVQFILRHDRTSELKFCVLNSNFADRFFAKYSVVKPNLDSVLFYTKGQLFWKSKAVFLIIKHLKWYLQFVRAFAILPTSWTDFIYDIVAKRRKKMPFSCSLIDEKYKKRFIQ